MAKILLGFMGAGKTTVGRILDPSFHDMDEIITEEIGMSINDFFALKGEAEFRRIEAATLERLLNQGAVIISPGGGIVVNPHNRELLEQNDYNIFLQVDFDTLYERIENDKEMHRPLYLNNTREQFKKIFDERQHLYEGIATHTIQVADKTPEEIAEIIRCL
ncbi:shikimate kinase [Streptococcus massiliensis]|uniref:Shikimate kinase n=1 Tax=Streptococcus massiliensis TaxID=313439 RepID=A0A380KUT3_9STRE|nr:shikimate kinase [Streptococcus massiliensis]SUN75652.1 shikimate kinase [Streptococcus massiliensis]